MSPAFSLITADLSPEDRAAFAAFVDRVRPGADDVETLRILLEIWITWERPDLRGSAACPVPAGPGERWTTWPGWPAPPPASAVRWRASAWT
ncbi:MAG: hypothetical protein AB7G23_01605 [Vicinamibacterales bacterium]